jgi:hypothetical protein
MKTYTIEPNVSLTEVVENMLPKQSDGEGHALDLQTANPTLNIFDPDMWNLSSYGKTINIPEYPGERPGAAAPAPAPKTTAYTTTPARTVVAPSAPVRPVAVAAPAEAPAEEDSGDGGFSIMSWINDPKKAIAIVGVAGILLYFLMFRKPKRAANPHRRAGKLDKLPRKILLLDREIDPSKYDTIEVQPLIELPGGDLEAIFTGEGKPFGYGIHLHLIEGHVQSQSDHPSKASAMREARRLSKKYGWPIEQL